METKKNTLHATMRLLISNPAEDVNDEYGQIPSFARLYIAGVGRLVLPPQYKAHELDEMIEAEVTIVIKKRWTINKRAAGMRREELIRQDALTDEDRWEIKEEL